jgi:RNA polymerase sigma-70 factor (ECF subfamily)
MFDLKKPVFERLVRAYSAELYRYAYWLCRDRFVAEDLVQETFARAWTGWAGLREEGAARKWLYTILHNEHARLFERKRLDIVEDQDLDALEDHRFGSVYGEVAMREALHALPTVYREPLLLQVLGGFSCEEIAKLMNVTPGAVMTRLSRARLALRKQSTFDDDSKEASA